MRRSLAWLLVGALGPAGLAHAAETPGPSVVWYRASEQCPNGAAFLTQTGSGAEALRLAVAGDRIDFVVTIAAEGGQVVGRLERQTRAGTVAIRELRDTDCGRVAEALALSLGLALAPTDAGQPDAGVGEQPRRVMSEAPVEPVAQTEAKTEAAEPATSAAEPARAPHPPSPASAPNLHSPPSTWAVGLQGGAVTGMQPRAAGRLEAFGELRGVVPDLLPTLRTRGSVVGALGAAPTDAGNVRRWIGALMLEVCPVTLGRMLAVAPCVGAELGMTGAAGAQQEMPGDTGLWAAVGARGRGTFEPIDRFGLVVDLGVSVPLTRYSVLDRSRKLYEMSAVGLVGELGVFFRLP